ncbi:hypothetical protein [Halomonas sp. SL1]|uniref:hypothetical protein n=1 Tax=Halomonas sp. SL1 TaxID=2137478 RepID=UPI000D163D74|nr:hypothetical protein [Halomonas sp. SL1]RAH37410.1 hypothetical protein C9J49_010940 [Halomonas sp. SL1]
MATNPNDIQLRIQAAVDGLQDIGKLLGELDDLGADTTAASADVEQLNEAMSSLGQQRKLIDALEQTRGKVDEAKGAMDEAVGEANRLKAAYDASAEGVDAQRRAAQQAAASAEQAGEAYQQQRRDLQALQTQYKGVQAETVGARQAWRDAAQRVRDLEAAIDASGEATDEQARQLEQARGAADEARRSYQRQADSLSGVRDRLQEQRQSVDQAKQAWEGYRDESKGLNRDLKDTERAFKQQERELGRAQQTADKARTSFERQGQALDELSQDAKRAGVDVDNLADEQQRLDRESEDLQGSVNKLKKRLREYRQEVGQTEGGIRSLGRRLAGGVRTFGLWAAAATAAAAALAVERITRYTSAQAKLAKQVDNTSQALGVNAQVLQEFQYAFDRLELGADKAGDLLKDVADKIGDAYVNGGGEAKDAIDALGLSVEDLVALSPDQQLLAIADAMSGMTQAGQVNILESLANDASLLQPLLENNAEGLRRLAREANEVGAIMTPEQIAGLVETESAIGRIVGRLQGLRVRLTSAVAPALTQVADRFDELLEDKPRLIDDIVTAFSGVVKATADWASGFLQHKEAIQSGLTGIIGTVNLLWQTIRTVTNSIQAVIGGLGTVFFGFMAGVTETIRQATGLLNRFGLVSDETLQRITAQSNETINAMNTMATFTKESAGDAVDALATIGRGELGVQEAAEQSADGQVAAHARVAQSALDAGDQVSQQRHDYDDVADAAEDSARRRIDAQNELDQVAINSAVLVGSTINEYQRLEEAANGIGMSLQELKTGISEAEASMIASFATLVKEGDLTQEQLNEAMSHVFEQLGPQARERLKEVVVAMDEAGTEGVDALRTRMQELFDDLKDGAQETVDAINNINNNTNNSGPIKEVKEETEEAEKAARSFSTTWQQVLKSASEGMRAVTSNSAQGMRFVREYRKEMIEWAKGQASAHRKAQHEAAGTRDIFDQLSASSGRLARRESRRIGGMEEARLATRGVEQSTAELNAEINDMVRLSGLSRDALRRMDATKLSQLRQEVRSVREEAESLTDSLSDTVAAMQRQLASLRGDTAEVQRLRHAEELSELEAQLARARELQDQEAIGRAREALKLSREVHEERMAQIKEQADEERQQEAERQASEARDAARSEVNQRERESFDRRQTDREIEATRQAAQAAQPTRATRIELVTPRGTARLTADSNSDEQILLDALGRDARRTY